MGAEGAEAADLNLAGLAGAAAAVLADADGLRVEVIVAAGHVGVNRRPFALR
jgi:hypothetical protein